MKLTSALFTKILTWLFLNMVLIAAALAIFFAFQPHVNLHAIFGQEGFNRLRSAGQLIAHDLARIPPMQWPDELARHASIHHVDFTVVIEDGSSFSSTEGTLPESVKVKVRDVFRNRAPRGGVPPPRKGIDGQPAPGPIPPGLSRKFRDFEFRKPPLKPKKEIEPHFTLRTKHPNRYWSGLLMPQLRSETPGPPVGALLLAVSDSITGKGFFFDPLPWLVVSAAVIFISVIFWIPMVGHITRPLARMTQATEEIANGRFDVPIHERRKDEIGRLAKAIRHMSSRLSAFVKGQKRFMGDVAHELGSPIARIQFGLGALEQRIEKGNRQRVIHVMEDVDHLSSLVNELLAFSRAEMKSSTVELEKIELLPVVQTAVKREMTQASSIDIRIDPMIRVVASSELLIRAISNLVRNALKYARAAGPIVITAEKRNGRVGIEVRDMGPGVQEDLIDQLFEPFFRPEASRNRDSGGVGLGLAIVRTCVETCNGTVSATNLEPTGFSVTITLQRA